MVRRGGVSKQRQKRHGGAPDMNSAETTPALKTDARRAVHGTVPPLVGLPRRMPTERAVRKCWVDRLWVRKGFDSREEFLDRGICFACGFDGEVHRAHIRARVDGGADAPDNLHMLCPTCHKDSEMLRGDEYMAWFWERTPMDRLVSLAARGGTNVWSAMMPNIPLCVTTDSTITKEAP